jgi:methylase of polypeptide subunit release factors
MLNLLNYSFPLNGRDNSNFLEASMLARHRWYYYKEGFSPSLVQHAINEYNLGEKSNILDPFNGSGTVTLTSSQNNIQSTGIEVNPFTAFVAESKTLSTKQKLFEETFEKVYEKLISSNPSSPLENYSTFSEPSGKNKWLFNLDILRSFSSGLAEVQNSNSSYGRLLKLILLSSIMEVSNARKDGKCLRYRPNWKSKPFTRDDFVNTYIKNYIRFSEDLEESKILVKPNILNLDSREIDKIGTSKYDLIITSPPYLNTFDYTDIYRPELFLGGFLSTHDDLYKLRHKTLRSHIQVNWLKPTIDTNECILLLDIFKKLDKDHTKLMDKKIPLMVLAYFEDMKLIFQKLAKLTKKGGHFWLVVSNSAYANIEVPVDLILADIASKNGWVLSEIGVLRNIQKRKTRHSPEISTLRESVIILEKK